MLKWFHHLLNPHCPECKAEREESKICNSCELLKMEVARLTADNERLLERILEKPEPQPERLVAPEPTTQLRPRQVPWQVRRQMLEAEDRQRAVALNNAAKPQTTEELEKELDIAGKERESQHTANS